MTERTGHPALERTEAYWALEQQTLFTKLRSGPMGLTDREARRRLASSPLASELIRILKAVGAGHTTWSV